jgi:hypothetical protein
MWKKVLGASACAGALMLALAGPATAAPTASDAAASPSAGIMVTWYPKHVKSTVSSVRVFTSPHGYVEWGAPWGPCTNFDVDRNDNGRYHTLIWYSGIKQDAWVTADPAYVAPGHCG